MFTIKIEKTKKSTPARKPQQPQIVYVQAPPGTIPQVQPKPVTKSKKTSTRSTKKNSSTLVDRIIQLAFLLAVIIIAACMLMK